MSTSAVATSALQAPRLLDVVRQMGLERFGRPDAAQAWVDWTRRFILFHNKRHPREMGAAEIGQYLQHVGQAGGSVDDVLNAREALTLLYEQVLRRSVGDVALPAPPRLLDRLRLALRVRHYSPRTEKCYVEWAERFIRFHGLRHPQEMGAAHVTAFLTNLAVRERVAASTQNQALNALVFLYAQVLGLELGRLDAVRA